MKDQAIKDRRRDGDMLSHIWFGMIIISVICGFCTGRAEELSAAAAGGADKAVQVLISMAGVMCLWTGIMKIADKSGLTAVTARLLSPVLSRLMPEYKKDSPAMKAVSANVTANIFGLGNAATPLGIAAMKEMQKTNRLGSAPNNSMVMFVVINTASVQLIPTTIAALRQAAGSLQPYAVVPYVWAASLLALLSGLGIAGVLSLKKEKLSAG